MRVTRRRTDRNCGPRNDLHGTYTHTHAMYTPHAPYTHCTTHAQQTYTQTYTTYTRLGPTRKGGLLKTPLLCPETHSKINKGRRTTHDYPRRPAC